MRFQRPVLGKKPLLPSLIRKNIHVDVSLFAVITFEPVPVRILPEHPVNITGHFGIDTSIPQTAVFKRAFNDRLIRALAYLDHRLDAVFFRQDIDHCTELFPDRTYIDSVF